MKTQLTENMTNLLSAVVELRDLGALQVKIRENDTELEATFSQTPFISDLPCLPEDSESQKGDTIPADPLADLVTRVHTDSYDSRENE